MISKNIIDFVADKLKIERQELVEKDFILQSILLELSKDKRFANEFAFKGGTCLIKCYFGYYRFSEDLDFTYINQSVWKNKSEGAVRKILSQKIDSLLIILKNISDTHGLDFKIDKRNHDYIEYGGSNKFVTFKIWYTSVILNRKTFIKIQVNFVEKLCYPLVETKATSIIKKALAKEIKYVSKEYSYLTEPANVKAYSLNELFVEKVRAIITRKGIKARDFIDIYLIQKEMVIGIKGMEKKIIEKTLFMLKYEKYLSNIKDKSRELEEEFSLEKEEGLLLKPLPNDFKKFVEENKPILEGIIKKIIWKQNKLKGRN